MFEIWLGEIRRGKPRICSLKDTDGTSHIAFCEKNTSATNPLELVWYSKKEIGLFLVIYRCLHHFKRIQFHDLQSEKVQHVKPGRAGWTIETPLIYRVTHKGCDLNDDCRTLFSRFNTKCVHCNSLLTVYTPVILFIEG